MQQYNYNICVIILHKADTEFQDYKLDQGCKCRSSRKLFQLLLFTVNCTIS